MISIRNAGLHNLKNVDVDIPLGMIVGIAGVSGSGKSSLIADTLVPALKEKMKSKCNISQNEEEKDEEPINTSSCALNGTNSLRGCYVIDQRPIGRSKTSCPATYTGIMDKIRELLAMTDKAVSCGYGAGVFTRNSLGGCQKCNGEGIIHQYIGYGKVIDSICSDCDGTGYTQEARSICLDNKNICDILELSVDEAIEFFRDKDSGITHVLEILQQVGMGYITLGQATPTISGGESQRIKLARELSKGKNTKGSLYILDEPTTGLSLYDTERLLQLMEELTEAGNSIIVTEHDPHILSNCDYIIELGRGGGSNGGEIIATGTPEELKHCENSLIGRFIL